MALLMVCSLVMYLPDMSIIVSAKSITVFAQTDSRWANHQYGYSNTAGTTPATISSGGCGILAYVNAVYYLNGSFIEPTYLADWSVNHGYRVNGVGTSLSLYKAFADSCGGNYGFTYNGSSSSYSTLREHLQSGEVAVGSAPGHLMAIADYDSSSGKFLILDSYRSSNRLTYPDWYTWQTESVCRKTAKLQFSSFYFLKSNTIPPVIDPIDTPVDNSYEVPCNRTATKKYDVYDRYGNAEYNSSGVRRYIAQNDECTIHEVYGSGYVKVTYPVGSGTHTAYAKNDGWGLTPKPVEAKPTFSILSANKYNYALGENIVFTANSDNNAKYSVGINDENGTRRITRDFTDTLVVSSNELGIGVYSAYVTSYNSAGYCDSASIWFLVSPQGSEMTSGAGQTIPNGDYVIVSEMNQDLYLDIPGTTVPAENNLVVNINNGHPGKGAEFDVWTVTYLNNGFYKITQKDTKMALDLYDNSLNRGTRTTVRTYSGAASQQWSINETKHGYQIQSRSTGWVLDVVGGNANPGTQTNVWEINDNKAQSWGFVPFASDDRPIPDGEYYIKSALADVWLDAWGNNDDKPFTNGTNIGILDAKSEKFKIEYVADGYYRITEVNSGLVLDLANGAVDSYLCIGNNIHLWTGGEKTQRNQLWRIKDEGNGYYTIISKLSGYCIDVQNSVVDNSTNVIQCFYNKSNAQKWSFEKVHKHTITATAAKAATCTANGNTAYWYCSGCKKYFSDSACTKEITLASTVVKAKGHSFGSWTTTKAASCTTDGERTRKCSSCGKTENQSIPAIGHKYVDTVVEPTCTEKGYTNHVCTNCGDSYTDSETAAKGHDHNKFETIPPTETTAGYDKHTCTVCGDFFIDNIVPPISSVEIPTVSYIPGDSSVRLTWTAVKNAEKYAVCGFINNRWQKLADGNGTSYTLKNLKAGTNYKVAVIAMVGGKWKQDFSNAIIVTPNKAESGYPKVTSEVSGDQFRLKWTPVANAEKYGIAVYQNNKWKVQVQVNGNVTTFTSPKVKKGTYTMVVCAKVNGKWDTSSINSRAFKVTIQ